MNIADIERYVDDDDLGPGIPRGINGSLQVACFVAFPDGVEEH